MPVTDASKKAVRRDESRTKVNNRRKRQMKEAIKEVKRLADEGGDTDALQEALSVAQKAIDKAAKQSIIHQNKANRKKSQLANMVAEAEA